MKLFKALTAFLTAVKCDEGQPAGSDICTADDSVFSVQCHDNFVIQVDSKFKPIRDRES